MRSRHDFYSVFPTIFGVFPKSSKAAVAFERQLCDVASVNVRARCFFFSLGRGEEEEWIAHYPAGGLYVKVSRRRRTPEVHRRDRGLF
jgi:hypothetical protein